MVIYLGAIFRLQDPIINFWWISHILLKIFMEEDGVLKKSQLHPSRKGTFFWETLYTYNTYNGGHGCVLLIHKHMHARNPFSLVYLFIFGCVMDSRQTVGAGRVAHVHSRLLRGLS